MYIQASGTESKITNLDCCSGFIMLFEVKFKVRLFTTRQGLFKTFHIILKDDKPYIYNFDVSNDKP